MPRGRARRRALVYVCLSALDSFGERYVERTRSGGERGGVGGSRRKNAALSRVSRQRSENSVVRRRAPVRAPAAPHERAQSKRRACDGETTNRSGHRRSNESARAPRFRDAGDDAERRSRVQRTAAKAEKKMRRGSGTRRGCAHGIVGVVKPRLKRSLHRGFRRGRGNRTRRHRS